MGMHAITCATCRPFVGRTPFRALPAAAPDSRVRIRSSCNHPMVDERSPYLSFGWLSLPPAAAMLDGTLNSPGALAGRMLRNE
jgi:hypothetical protein